ncbi:MAG: phage virion morphogenesis protein [Azonexus sp.]|jgi:phage virion morphogenesis protein|nr:phage virion morphogenesis protein [Azonexus sp.]
MDVGIQIDDAAIKAGLTRLAALGRDLRPVMAGIAAIGEAATRLRFHTETGPDGVKWQPSLRAQISGGRTLTKDGHLGDSVSASHSADFAEWGVNRPYAAIHQFGGVIRPKKKAALRFALAGGGFATVKSVNMPARPYLGLSDEDRQSILALITTHIEGAAHAG